MPGVYLSYPFCAQKCTYCNFASGVFSRAVNELRVAGITNRNIDLIAGLPGQTTASWNESLDWVERLEVPHVSVYMLEVDEDSRLGSELLVLGKRYGAPEVPDEDQIADS